MLGTWLINCCFLMHCGIGYHSKGMDVRIDLLECATACGNLKFSILKDLWGHWGFNDLLCSNALKWPASARMSVCKMLLNNSWINWSLTWIGTRSNWQLGQKNLQSMAADFNQTVHFWIDSTGDCVICPKSMLWMVGLDLLVTTDSITLRRLF